MSSGLIEIIKKVALDVMQEHQTQILFGKVKTVEPLVINVSDRWELTREFIVLDTPVEPNEDVIIIKYSNANKYLVLSTIEKVYTGSVSTGGIVETGYSTEGQWKPLGTFKITHYCAEKYPHICNAGAPYTTATGTPVRYGVCAVDPKVIPLGSYIKINGVVYHAEDTGGAIKGKRIDLAVNTHSEALEKGTYKTEVFLKVGD